MLNHVAWASDSPSKRSFRLWSTSNIKYDKVVDYGSFRPDREQVRAFHATGQGSTSQPVYDDEKNMPSDVEVEIRSGKLDKAEISQLQQIKVKKAEEAISEAEKESARKQAEKLEKARQEHLDKVTGFKGADASVTE